MQTADAPKLTYSCQFRRCGKPDCPRCRPGARGHGPYWYAYWWEDGRTRSRYLGKTAPPEAADSQSVPQRPPPPPTRRRRGRRADQRAAPGLTLAPQTALRVRTLGAFQVWRGDAAIAGQQWTRRRAAALFKILLSAPAHRLHREQAIELLWPDTDPGVPPPNLRAVVYLLRQILDAPDAAASHVQITDDLLVLHPNPTSEPSPDWLDAVDFAAAARTALKSRSLAECRRALALYTGDYLPADIYDPWAADRREELRGLYLELLVHLARLCAAPEPGAHADPEEAMGYLKLVLAADPCQEHAARMLIRLLARAGRRAEALRAYETLATALRDDLGLAPASRTQALYAALLGQSGTEKPAPALRQGGESGAVMPSSTVTLLLILPAGPAASRRAGTSTLTEDPLLTVIARHGGQPVPEYLKEGGHLTAFGDAASALAAACDLHSYFSSGTDSAAAPVTMAIHTARLTMDGGDSTARAIMRCAQLCSLAHAGQVLVSPVTEGLVHDTLPPGMGLRPLGAYHLAGADRPEALFQLLHPALPAAFPALKVLRSPNPLPLPLTSFIGRTQELALARGLLGYGDLPGADHLQPTRLLTVTGAGGCGKTRLALQLAAGLLDRFEEGVWLVELWAIDDPALLPQTVLTALGLREEPGRAPQETISAVLEARRLLLVLDNCEHLIEACAELAVAVLRSCPAVKMLATSRQALGIGGETVLRLPPLSLPPPHRAQPPVEQLLAYEAVSLFVARVRAGRPAFALTTQNAPAVLQICRRLDGIPLAIELAAARVGVLTVDAIAARLDDRFRLLAAGSRTTVARQQTLRATVDWSYNLLSGTEQSLLCCLAVFAGGWTFEAAEAIAAGESVPAADVLDLLGTLIAKSLVQTNEQGGETRYGLLETVREFARDHLRAQGAEDVVRARHARWYADLARAAAPHLRGPDQQAWLERLEVEHDNLRAALSWALEHGATDQGLSMATSLARFWSIRGHLSEGRRWLGQLLSAGEAATPLVRANAAREAGLLATYQGDHLQARPLLLESLTMCRALGDTPGTIAALQRLADLTYREGDYERTEALFAESLILARQEHDRYAIAHALNGLGNVANEQGAYTLAAERYQEALDLLRAVGDGRTVAIVLNNLANIAFAKGEFARAAALHEGNIGIRRALGDRMALATTLGNLGKARKALGDLAEAQAHFEEALALAREIAARLTIADTLAYLTDLRLEQGDLQGAAGSAAEALATYCAMGDKRGIASALEAIASVAIARLHQTYPSHPDELVWAVRLLAAGEALRASIGLVAAPEDRRGREQRLAAARTLLGEQAYNTAWAEGESLSLEDALAQARSNT